MDGPRGIVHGATDGPGGPSAVTMDGPGGPIIGGGGGGGTIRCVTDQQNSAHSSLWKAINFLHRSESSDHVLKWHFKNNAHEALNVSIYGRPEIRRAHCNFGQICRSTTPVTLTTVISRCQRRQRPAMWRPLHLSQ